MSAADKVILVLASLPILPRVAAFFVRICEEIAHDGTRGLSEWSRWKTLREKRYIRHLQNTSKEVLATAVSLVVFIGWAMLTETTRTNQWWFFVAIACVFISAMLVRTLLRPNEKPLWL